MTAVFTLAAPAAQAAPKLSLQSRQVTAAMPVFRSEFPRPKDGGQVFFIQRSPNSNTVVYAARVTGGQLDAKSPVSAYWRRYNTDGAAKGLSGMERRLAYGVSASSNGDGTYDVSFKALPTVKPILRVEKGRPALFTRMGDEEARMIYAYLDVDDGGLFPRVTGLKLVGRLASGKYVTETYRVTGGEL
ncbi:DUF4833 domain-containing protein [Pseudooceanicola sp.]|uniref:DUF4833 domain-containing protein n=1 Tax=Pseudooceanicola sp. TaxID=1914328 RepID=UPI00262A08B8|nr:DUF4833 domain-containing protein [Pseudooceanicola sp.]